MSESAHKPDITALIHSTVPQDEGGGQCFLGVFFGNALFYSNPEMQPLCVPNMHMYCFTHTCLPFPQSARILTGAHTNTHTYISS